ncbi:hypothetical protein [Hydromonas duriensis]|uniref:Uncharacterized protein n=1 Tax=Hydromonas duriensis TaxID=1527608 RepID=A0A4R6Y609_9BURK|nr:hypothetical protein [Hydromonas duriensis]TDR29093.1 hypothetical protein DFR44_12614 [Hydromonas duriensis]
MRLKKLGFISALFVMMSGTALANDESTQVVGMDFGSSNSGPALVFDVSDKKDNNIVGIRGEMPLTEKDRAMQKFRERMGQRSSVEVYGQVDLGYEYRR